VKATVYAPDWRTDQRRDYTMKVADVLASMLPEAIEGSISTVPGSFQPWVSTSATAAMAPASRRDRPPTSRRCTTIPGG